MKNNPLISVISVNYNGVKDTLEMLDSVFRFLSGIDFEVIVVDNGSRQDEGKLIAAAYPQVITIRSEENLGFAGGNNLGIRESKGNYLFFINNDTYLTEGGIGELVATMQQDASIGGISPMIRFAFPPQDIQFAGYTSLSYATLRNRLIGFGEQPGQRHHKSIVTPYLHGAAMIIPRSVILEAGEMPECYFLYYEELDWSLRITERGYKLLYDPRWVVFHKESQSTGTGSPLKSYYLTRNRLLFAKRNCGLFEKYLAFGYQHLVVIPKTVIQALCAGKKDIALAALKGLKSFYSLK